MSITKIMQQVAFSKLAKPLVTLTGNRCAQDALDRLQHVCQHLMGIGPGADCRTSGESIVFKVLREASSPPFTIFDVGANVGLFIEMISEHLTLDSYVVHAFEPSADTFRDLQASATNHDCCVLNNLALGAAEGTATLYSDCRLSALASLTRRDVAHEQKAFDRTEEVRVTTLDEYCRKKDIKSIDLLKIDAEGHDLDVMKGGEDLFRRGAIGIATFELASAQIDSRVFFRDMFKFVRGHGMEVFRITRSGYLYHIPEYHERQEQFWATNYLCIREDMSTVSRTTASSRRPKGRG
jgi:FkbM family methyltransferase